MCGEIDVVWLMKIVLGFNAPDDQPGHYKLTVASRNKNRGHKDVRDWLASGQKGKLLRLLGCQPDKDDTVTKRVEERVEKGIVPSSLAGLPWQVERLGLVLRDSSISQSYDFTIDHPHPYGSSLFHGVIFKNGKWTVRYNFEVSCAQVFPQVRRANPLFGVFENSAHGEIQATLTCDALMRLMGLPEKANFERVGPEENDPLLGFEQLFGQPQATHLLLVPFLSLDVHRSLTRDTTIIR